VTTPDLTGGFRRVLLFSLASTPLLVGAGWYVLTPPYALAMTVIVGLGDVHSWWMYRRVKRNGGRWASPEEVRLTQIPGDPALVKKRVRAWTLAGLLLDLALAAAGGIIAYRTTAGDRVSAAMIGAWLGFLVGSGVTLVAIRVIKRRLMALNRQRLGEPT
jgi:hypothetical protein